MAIRPIRQFGDPVLRTVADLLDTLLRVTRPGSTQNVGAGNRAARPRRRALRAIRTADWAVPAR